MTEFWLCFDCILTTFWLNFDCILTAFWLHFDCILSEFWMNFVWILTEFWLHFDWILTVFWQNFDCILTLKIGLFWSYLFTGTLTVDFAELLAEILTLTPIDIAQVLNQGTGNLMKKEQKKDQFHLEPWLKNKTVFVVHMRPTATRLLAVSHKAAIFVKCQILTNEILISLYMSFTCHNLENILKLWRCICTKKKQRYSGIRFCLDSFLRVKMLNFRG